MNRIFEPVMFIVIAVTAVVALCTPKVSTDETLETVHTPTTAPTVVETQTPTQTPTQVPTETTQPVTDATQPPETTVETEPPVILYDVPLAEDLQLHIIEEAEEQGIDPAIIFAMIKKESNYNASAVGDGGKSLGLMQIQSKWHSGWMEQLNCPDLLDPFQNVTVGIHILADHFHRYGDIEMALVAYNSGATGAKNNYFSKGVYSSKYSKAVLDNADKLRGGTYAVFG